MLPLWGKYDSQSWYIVVYLQYASILVRIYYPYLKVVSLTPVTPKNRICSE